jgi:hypothetical protein
MDGGIVLLTLVIIVLIVVFARDRTKKVKELEEKFNNNTINNKEFEEYKKLVDYKKLQKKYVNGTATENERELFKQKIAEDVERNKIFIEKAKAERQAHTIKKVMIVAEESNSQKKVGSTIMRGAIGGALLGPVGLVGGALSGKNKVTSKTTFLIEYEDGHRETKIVDNDSYEFEKLCKYLNM